MARERGQDKNPNFSVWQSTQQVIKATHSGTVQLNRFSPFPHEQVANRIHSRGLLNTSSHSPLDEQMRVNEIFLSRQGEGRLTGVESVFVRVTGCNLRCVYCDTPYASWDPEGEDLLVEEIVGRAVLFDCRYVVITGGEPMLYPELVRLTDMLHERERHITIETAGTVDQAVHCDLMSISPKLANSTPGPDAGEWSARHDARRHRPDVIRRLMTDYNYQLKFVVDAPEDCEEIVAYLKEFPEAASDRVLLMPQGTESDELEKRAEWLIPYCESQGFTYCPRRQIEWYGNKRRT